MDIHSILTNANCVPEPEPLGERPHIVYASDVKHPHFDRKMEGIKRPVYWTTAAVMAVLEKVNGTPEA